jgi:hypothetical protein
MPRPALTNCYSILTTLKLHPRHDGSALPISSKHSIWSCMPTVRSTSRSRLEGFSNPNFPPRFLSDTQLLTKLKHLLPPRCGKLRPTAASRNLLKIKARLSGRRCDKLRPSGTKRAPVITFFRPQSAHSLRRAFLLPSAAACLTSCIQNAERKILPYLLWIAGGARMPPVAGR